MTFREAVARHCRRGHYDADALVISVVVMSVVVMSVVLMSVVLMSVVGRVLTQLPGIY
jgi:hypothetical protein